MHAQYSAVVEPMPLDSPLRSLSQNARDANPLSPFIASPESQLVMLCEAVKRFVMARSASTRLDSARLTRLDS